MSAVSDTSAHRPEAAALETQQPVLDIRDLSIAYRSEAGDVRAVRDVSLALNPGEVVGLAGESGCGKSTLAYGSIRLLRPPAVITGGSVTYHGRRVGPAGVDVLAAKPGPAPRAPLARDRDRVPERDELAQPGAARARSVARRGRRAPPSHATSSDTQGPSS